MNTPNSSLETSFFVTGSAQTAAAFSIALNGTVPFSVTAWVNFESVQDAADILMKNGVFRFGGQGQQVYVVITGLPGLWSDGVTHPITQDAWHYIACVYTGTQLQLYIDGDLDSQVLVSGTGADNAEPFVIANNFQGRLTSVRIYNTALSAALVLEAMFQPDAQQSYVANFDFTLNPPADTSGNNLPLTLSGNTSINTVAPAVRLVNSAYCQPIRDDTVNPGGAGNDPYSIQAWIWLEAATATITSDGLVPAGQAVFVNQTLDDSAGIALYLVYDTTANLYRLASLRGDITIASNSLVSLDTIPFGQWVNVATTYDPTTSTLALYINGQVDTSSATFPTILALASPNILIGGAVLSSQPASGWTLQGYIQTVDIWDIPLTGTQIQGYLTAYPVLDSGLTAHYDFTSYLARNENTGSPVGLADQASSGSETSPAASVSPPAVAAVGKQPAPGEPVYEQLPPDEMARLRAGISFADSPHLEQLLDEAMQRDLGANLHLFVPTAIVPRFRAQLAAEWMRVRHLMRERPLELRYVITYHQLNGEHVIIHHTPVRSTVVLRAPLGSYDPCTLWRLSVIWGIVAGLLSVLGVTASQSSRVNDFILNRILGNPRVAQIIANTMKTLSAGSLFTLISNLQGAGVLWPLIKTSLAPVLSWWALSKLLVKLLTRVFGGWAAAAAIIISLAVAVLNLIYIYSQQPSGCPLIPPTQDQTRSF